ncbi:MAG: zinc ribbon domain-containing protein [Clostridia bacterium]
MALWKFRCTPCGFVFDELVSSNRMGDVVCTQCGSASIQRA